ncbi:MAG TPA: MFS transporter [Candidatus Saccharimonadales bacterium]|nr:MFS transporter [Candidatus Saccharimonadales bacterium]
MKKWTVVAILAIAQFVMVLDSTVMNVSISQVVKDLGTTVSGLQAAITFYTLTMAALMLTGGKLGDKWGRLNAFKIGAVVYGIGSLITALSPNLGVLMFGWSLIEGLGAILIIPAIASLVAYNYDGKPRVTAFAIIGGVSGAAAAAGPLIGGFVTTYFSWRYVFAAETLIVIGLLLVANKIKDPGRPKEKITIDLSSVLLSASGMFLFVFGLLQSKTWGWIRPLAKPTINGQEIAPFGISIVAYLIVIGLFVLWLFYVRQDGLEKKGKQALLKVSMLSIKVLRAGLAVLASQYLITAAIFFAIPIYLQMVLGLDALQTGIKIFPLSVALILASVVGSRLANNYPPKKIIRVGQLALVIGSLLLFVGIEPTLTGGIFGAGMFVVGAGLGLLASQLGNVNMSSVSDNEANEAGGLQGTAQNLGSSLGTALIGSLLIFFLTSSFVTAVNQNPDLPSSVKQAVAQASQKGIEIIPASQVEQIGLDKGLTQDQAEELTQTYTESQVGSLQQAMFFVVIFAVLSFILSRNIPDKIVAKK